MRSSETFGIIALLGLCFLLFEASPGFAEPGHRNGNNNSGNPSQGIWTPDSQNVQASQNLQRSQNFQFGETNQNSQRNQNNQVTQDKSRDEYAKHIKEAEQAHREAERQEKSALFKSNVRKALEHGHAGR